VAIISDAGGSMGKFLCVLSILIFAGCSTFAQDAPKPAPAEFKVPPEASKLANPVKSTPASISQAKKVYEVDCLVCHGPDGDGKGDLAADMKTKLADYRDPSALKAFTDGDLFYIIKNGKGEMPSEGDRAKPGSIWNLVNYIRSLAKKDSSAKATQ
jgi:mono/diheme cytochrome c family protein